jgi:hypothetical protein
MTTNTIAEKTFVKFSKFDGNQHIANEYALKCILKLIDEFKLKSVLELGIGIGCIADAVLEYSNTIDYTATEKNEFCLRAIQTNIKEFSKVKVYNDLSAIPENSSFDFIIIDGLDDGLEMIKKVCNNRTVIFIEGGRALQLGKLKSIFPNFLHTQMISTYKNHDFSPFSSGNWCSGGQLIFPYPNLKMKLFYWKERIATYIKRKYRKYKK